MVLLSSRRSVAPGRLPKGTLAEVGEPVAVGDAAVEVDDDPAALDPPS